ncbi:AMP-binding protein [Streptomyces sp. SID8382]|uniref:AMP-binding protein n=1 Tax=Streptomyces malaysiensis TaxID=92644 RepID=UPI000CA1E256|nr:AMP-binding protein [Streptomyces sp. M56]AUA07960.1 Dimodular nonribosomal peptide synthase [Streptomyces sp. M56]MYX62485.1 AMP-binding protein [Streptomyces sp. SID8382]
MDDDGRATTDADAAESATSGARPFTAGVGYLGFTSGSRGAPQAIVGSAAGLLHFVTWQCKAFDIGPDDRFGQLTSPGFDVFYRDLLTPLLGGASLCVPGAEQLAGARVLDWLAAARVTRLHAVPSLARYWLRSSNRIRLPDLTTTFFAGEALTDTLVRDWRSVTGSRRRLVNLYGTAEATLAQAWFEVPADCALGTQPVGTPVPGVRLHVRDPEGVPCPPGTTGEIVAESPYLSYGYLTDHGAGAPAGPQLCAPLTRHGTGDRGYLSADGLLHVVGRLDREVKIRGVRVNLDEVGVALTGHPAIDTAVVVTGTDRAGDMRLEVHLTTRARPAPAPYELRRHLAESLLAPMIPTVFHMRTDYPLGLTGKAAPSAFVPHAAAASRTSDPNGPPVKGGTA